MNSYKVTFITSSFEMYFTYVKMMHGIIFGEEYNGRALVNRLTSNQEYHASEQSPLDHKKSVWIYSHSNDVIYNNYHINNKLY